MAKKIKKHPCVKCAEIKKRKRGARPPVVRTQRKQAPVIINLQQPTAPYLPSLANQYMNMPFQGPPMGNQLARRVVPAVIPDDYVEPVLVVRAPSVQNSIRDSISDISDISPESYGYEGSLPSSLYQSEQSFRDYESLPAPYPPSSYPSSSYFQLPMPAFEPIGRQSNNLPSAPISFEDDFEQSLSKAEAELNAIFTPPVDFSSSPIREDDFSDMSLSEKSASIRSGKSKSDITIPPSLFEERTFVPAAEPILPSIAGIYDDLDLGLDKPIGKPIPDVIPPAEIPTALAMPISKGDDITPIKSINPALVEKLKEDDIRALNTFDEIKSIKKSERTPEQEKDFKRAQYLQTQQRGKVAAFEMSELYKPTYTPEKLAVGGEGPILAEKVDDFSNYTAQDRSDLEKYRGAKDIKKSERTPEQQRIVDRVDKTLSKRKNYDAFLNSGKVIPGGIPVASELVEDEPEKEPFFFEDKPITGSVAFNISKPITTKRQPSIFEERATVIPESFEEFPTELAPEVVFNEYDGEFAFDEDGAKITIRRDADDYAYAVNPSDGNTYDIYDAEDENGNPSYTYWKDADGNERKIFMEDTDKWNEYQKEEPTVDEAEDEDEDEDEDKYIGGENGKPIKVVVKTDADGDEYFVNPDNGVSYWIYDAENENDGYSYWEDDNGDQREIFTKDTDTWKNYKEQEEQEERERQYEEERRQEEEENLNGLYELLDRAGINRDEPITMDDVYRFEKQLDAYDDRFKKYKSDYAYAKEKYYDDMEHMLFSKGKILPSTKEIIRRIYGQRGNVGYYKRKPENQFMDAIRKMIAAQRPTPAPTFSLLAPPLKITSTPVPTSTIPEDY